MAEDKENTSKSGKQEEKGNKQESKGGNSNKNKGGSTPRSKKGSASSSRRTSRSRSAYSGRQSRCSSKPNTPRSQGGQTPRDGRTKQKEYFKEELKRVKQSLEEDAAKIEEPEPKEFTPNTFNALKPYYNVHSAEFLSQLPEEMRHGYVNRKTAVGLCDPWDDLKMDQDVEPKPESKPVLQEEEKKKKKDDKDRPPKEGSTHLPKYPCVTMPTGEYATKQLYFSDVPMLREELREKYSTNAEKKIEEDYKRTKEDFYRMELDKMDEYHPVSRPNMRKTYFAYLQNTTGSRKALYDCVKDVEKKEKGKQKQKEQDKQKQKPKQQQQQQQKGQSSRRESQATNRQSTKGTA